MGIDPYPLRTGEGLPSKFEQDTVINWFFRRGLYDDLLSPIDKKSGQHSIGSKTLLKLLTHGPALKAPDGDVFAGGNDRLLEQLFDRLRIVANVYLI